MISMEKHIKLPEEVGKKEDEETIAVSRKQLYWVLGGMAVIVFIFLVAQSYFRGLHSFDYEGLSFTKEQFGEIPVYHHYYYYKDSNGELVKNNVFLRNDPRLNVVPVTGAIIFNQQRRVLLGIDTAHLTSCPKSSLAIAELSSFLVTNEFEVIPGVLDKNVSRTEDKKYISCDLDPSDSVVIIKESNETKITAQDRCITIEVANCSMLDAVERFKLQALIDLHERRNTV